MRKFSSILGHLVRDEQGGETLEYALVLALLVIGAIMLLSKMGVRAVARWSSIEQALAY